MSFRALVPGLSVAGQIELADLAAAKASGIRSIVNNRPDGEAPGQPASAELRAEAERLGLVWRDLPVVSGQMSAANARDFAAALAEMPSPALAFCRSGTRSTRLWALSQAGGRPADEIIAAGRRAGYDLEDLRPLLERAGPA